MHVRTNVELFFLISTHGIRQLLKSVHDVIWCPIWWLQLSSCISRHFTSNPIYAIFVSLRRYSHRRTKNFYIKVSQKVMRLLKLNSKHREDWVKDIPMPPIAQIHCDPFIWKKYNNVSSGSQSKRIQHDLFRIRIPTPKSITAKIL